MKYTLLICWLLCKLALNVSWAVKNPLSTTAKSATHSFMAGIDLQITPASSTYSVGQSLTVVMTGGQEGITYALTGLESFSASTPMSSVSIVNEQGTNNTVTWQANQNQAVFLVRFLAGSEGIGRLLKIEDTDPNGTDMTTSGEVTIIPGPVLTLSPALSAYSVGQSLTVTMTGGIAGRDYIIRAYSSLDISNDDNDLSGDITPFTSQSTVNYVTWKDEQTALFYIRLDKSSKGSNRYFVVTDIGFTHVGNSDSFIICSGSGSTQAMASDIVIPTPLGPDNCSVTVQTQAQGNSFVFTGPDNYVFSSVFRNTGTYQVSAPITKPGTYQLTVTYDDYCGKSSATKSFTVTGTACK